MYACTRASPLPARESSIKRQMTCYGSGFLLACPDFDVSRELSQPERELHEAASVVDPPRGARARAAAADRRVNLADLCV